MNSWSDTIRFGVAPFLAGALVLSLFSIPQKVALGSDPAAIRGYIVPVLFGGLVGVLLGNFRRKLKLEHKES